MFFENRFTMEKEMYQEFIRKILCRRTILIVMIFSPIAALTILFTIRNSPTTAAIEATCLAILLSVGIATPKLILKRYLEMDQVLQNGTPSECVVVFDETITITQGMQSISIEYNQVFKIYKLKTCSILMFTKQNGIIYVEDQFTSGNVTDFEPFILEKCRRVKCIERR